MKHPDLFSRQLDRATVKPRNNFINPDRIRLIAMFTIFCSNNICISPVQGNNTGIINCNSFIHCARIVVNNKSFPIRDTLFILRVKNRF